MNRAERRRRAKQVKHTGHAPGLEGALREAIGRHQAGDIRGAEQLYRRILGREPDNADAHHLLGMTDLQLGDIDRAERRIRHAIELAPEHANYWSNLGIVLKRQGAAADALAATRKAITLEPERNSFWINFAEGLRQLSFSGFDRDAATDVVRCLSPRRGSTIRAWPRPASTWCARRRRFAPSRNGRARTARSRLRSVRARRSPILAIRF